MPQAVESLIKRARRSRHYERWIVRYGVHGRMSRPLIPRLQDANSEISVEEFRAETVSFHRLATWAAWHADLAWGGRVSVGPMTSHDKRRWILAAKWSPNQASVGELYIRGLHFTPKGLHPNGGKTASRKSIPTWQSLKEKTRGVIDKHPRTLLLAPGIGLNNAARSPSRNTTSN